MPLRKVVVVMALSPLLKLYALIKLYFLIGVYQHAPKGVNIFIELHFKVYLTNLS